MADLIDRDAVLHDVSTECSNAHEAKYYEAQVALTRAKRIIRDAPAVNRWIPCSERLPETIEPVIFSVERGYKQVCCGYRYGKHRMWKDRISGLHYMDYDVIAWMPMPDAYEPPEKTPES